MKIVTALTLTAIGAAGFIGGIISGVSIEREAHPEPMGAWQSHGADGYWSLIRVDDRGDEFVVDYDMSFQDCMDAGWPRMDAWECTRQPDGPIG